jgi:uncharacterized protein YbjT (DUF2867 family)
VNTLTGDGLDGALAGADVLIDVSNSPSFEDAAVLEFFRTSTTNLVTTARAAGVRHYVALSVVGTERRPDIGYFRAKLAQEELIRQSSIPFSLVHATQFFEFVTRIADEGSDGPSVRMAPVAFQPVAADDVARLVGRTATGTPLNDRVELGGPQRYRMDEFFRDALATLGDPRRVVTDEHAHYFGAELGPDDLVPIGATAVSGEIAFDDWAAALAAPRG